MEAGEGRNLSLSCRVLRLATYLKDVRQTNKTFSPKTFQVGDFGFRPWDFGLRPLAFGLSNGGLWTLDFGLWTLDLNLGEIQRRPSRFAHSPD
jgi:hypothetical protein